MKTKKIAFQGELGAYSDEAAHTYFGDNITLFPFRDLSDVFDNVTNRNVDLGVVPIENSTEGSVNQTYDLLLDTSLIVCGELDLRISHCLIGNINANISDIEKIYSHPQALAQCSKFLKQKKWNTIPEYDTAGSVKFIKSQKITSNAAIASSRSAEIYGMKILRRKIEDNPDNYTRFLIISNQSTNSTGSDKTSIIFSVSHSPGSLYKVLEDFATRKINLTKIQSRPTKKEPWSYNFYLDFEGHINDLKYRELLKTIKPKCGFLKILGSYPKTKR